MIFLRINLNIAQSAFNKVYFPYLKDYSHRYEIYYGGAGSGKSVFVVQKLLIKALFSKRKVLVIRNVMATHSASTWQLLVDTLSNWNLLCYCKLNKSLFTIELPNGSIFLFKGMDDSEKIKSIANITDIWIEESTEISFEKFSQLDLRLRSKEANLQMILSFNPISKANWCYKHWFERKQDTDTFILKTTYKDNRFLTADYIAALEKMIETNPTYYRIYALGEFCSLDRLVYTNYEVREFDFTKIGGTPLCGLDFGFVTDVTAFVAAMLCEEDKTIYIYKEWCATNKTNDEIAAALKSLGYSKSLIVADSAEPKSIEELRKAGIVRIRPSVKGADSIIHGIQKIQQYKLIVHTSCVETITELENYSWKKDKSSGEYINKPIDSFNHCLDAIRYGFQCVKDNKLKSISKNLL